MSLQRTGSFNRLSATVLLTGCALLNGCAQPAMQHFAKNDSPLQPPVVRLVSERDEDGGLWDKMTGREKQIAEQKAREKAARQAAAEQPVAPPANAQTANYNPQSLPPGAEQLPPGAQAGPSLGQPGVPYGAQPQAPYAAQPPVNPYAAPTMPAPAVNPYAAPVSPAPAPYQQQPQYQPPGGAYPPISQLPPNSGGPIAPAVQPSGNVPNEAPIPIVPSGEVPVSSAIGTDEQPGTPFPSKQPEGIEKFYPSNIQKSALKAVGGGPNQKVADEAFAEGEKLFAQKKYKDAAKKYHTAAIRWPDTALEEDAMFKQGEAYFFDDRYPDSEDAYSDLIKKYPNSRYLDLAVARIFSIARYWEQTSEAHPHWPTTPNLIDKSRPLFDTAGHATRAFDNVRINDPRGPLADDAIMANGNANFVRGRWEDADYYYTLLRKDYPKSQHQVQSHLLSLQCKLRNYQGAGYSTKPLQEAQELIVSMKTQFPSELRAEMPRLEVAYKECRAQLATRDYELAKWYDNGKHYGAARIMYAAVIKNYSDTNFANESQTRIAQLNGKPDETPSWYEPAIKPFESEKAIARQAGPASSSQR